MARAIPEAAAGNVDGGLARDRLRLWIRMIRTTRAIEIELRHRLRTEFDETMPRFDVMAALHRQPGGMMMSELSRALMVSNGNVTPIIERLVTTGMVTRCRRKDDRRSLIVALSATGKRYFQRVADRHRQWVDELFDELDDDQIQAFNNNLNNLSRQIPIDNES